MKILAVSKYFYPVFGGVESVVYYVEREIAKSENVTVLASGKGPEKVEGMKVVRLPAFHVGPTPISPSVFSKILKQDFDICHLHEPNPFQNFFAYLALRLKRKPYVITYHSDIVPHNISMKLFKSFYLIFQRLFLLRNAQCIMPTSPNYVPISDVLPYFKEKLEVVPNGVDLKKFYPRKAKRKKTVLFAGRLIYYKGLQYLIKAMKTVQKKIPDAELIVVGEGPLREEWKKMADELSINVTWLGHIPEKEIHKQYQTCGVFVLPSIFKTEAFGIALLEAMACGAPVITTDISGTVFAVGDAGIVVKPKDEKALANAIMQVLKNERVTQEMSRKSLKQVKKFEWKKIAGMTEKIYRSVVG
jgi:glycosyltransferase involved in cell wall biosynthesis